MAFSVDSDGMHVFHITEDLIPQQMRKFISSTVTDWWNRVFDHTVTVVIQEFEGPTYNHLYEAAHSFCGEEDLLQKSRQSGYLFYGLPGTGKSSLVAAMANHLRFDVYYLDLKEVHCNSDLTTLLIASADRSILVIEYIDCSATYYKRQRIRRRCLEMIQQRLESITRGSGGGRPKHQAMAAAATIVRATTLPIILLFIFSFLCYFSFPCWSLFPDE